VIRGSSWPIQNMGGEFRYNLVVDSGHSFWRNVAANTLIRHNVFTHSTGSNTGYAGCIEIYDETGIVIRNNTFDVGGTFGDFDAPGVNIADGGLVQSLRNNLFTNFSNISNFGSAFISTADASVGTPRVTSANFNAFYNPLAPGVARYRTGIVAGTAGASDVLTNPKLSGTNQIPYRISEGCVWLGNCTTGQVLAHYRAIYKPATGSPLIGAGDPADGTGTDIGAVGHDGTHALDKFGLVVP